MLDSFLEELFSFYLTTEVQDASTREKKYHACDSCDEMKTLMKSCLG